MVVSNFTLSVALTGNFHAEQNLTIHHLDRSCKIHVLCVPNTQRKKFIFRILAAGLCAPYSGYLEYRHFSYLEYRHYSYLEYRHYSYNLEYSHYYYNCPERASFALLLVKLTVLMFSECCPSRINVFSSGTLISSLLLNS